MIKILHTADWHLGQSFYQNDRTREHLIFFEWIKDVVATHNVDALLIAGDVFDNPNPSAMAQKMFFKLLRELNNENPHLQVIIIAGNHDSAARLEAPVPVLEEMNVIIKGVVPRTADGQIDYHSLLVPIFNREGKQEAIVVAAPFLRQGDHPVVDESGTALTYQHGIKAFYAQALAAAKQTAQPNNGIIAMGHLQASGAMINDGDSSERVIIGGLEGIDANALFPGEFTYVALGHLHRAQKVARQNHIRYAGSPLPMSFAELNYTHGVEMVVIDDGHISSIEKIVFEPPVKLLSVPARFENLGEDEAHNLQSVLRRLRQLPDGELNPDSPYLLVRVSFRETIINLRQEIEQALKGKNVRLAHTVTENVNRFDKQAHENITFETIKEIDPLAMARMAFEQKDQLLSPQLEAIFNEVVEEYNNQQK